jgi:UrcA family protein
MRSPLIAVGCILMGAGSAVAEPGLVVTREAVPTAVVSFADLNIWSQAGQSQLTHRIRAAASDICIDNYKVELEIGTLQRRCFNTALNSGMRQMNMAIASQPGTLATSTLIISAH